MVGDDCFRIMDASNVIFGFQRFIDFENRVEFSRIDIVVGGIFSIIGRLRVSRLFHDDRIYSSIFRRWQHTFGGDSGFVIGRRGRLVGHVRNFNLLVDAKRDAERRLRCHLLSDLRYYGSIIGQGLHVAPVSYV